MSFERGDAQRPGREIALHEQQVAIVLQAFLELVRREQVIQIARLGRVRQRGELPVPADLVGLVVGDDRLEQVSAADRRDRLIDALRFLAEGFDGEHVLLRRLLGRIELRIGVRNRQVRFLHGSIEHVAAAQLEPGRQRLRVPLLGRVRPAGAEQRLVRLRAFQAHALQHRLRVVGATGLQPRDSRARGSPCRAARRAPRSALRSGRRRRAASPLRRGAPCARAQRRC